MQTELWEGVKGDVKEFEIESVILEISSSGMGAVVSHKLSSRKVDGNDDTREEPYFPTGLQS